MTRLPRILTVAVTIALSVAACKTSSTTVSGPVAKKSLKIAMIAKSSTNPVFLSARTGAETAAKELSAKNGIEITIDWRTPPTEDGQVQAQRISQAVNEGADVMLVSCSDAAKITGAINDAVARGVPVMTFDSDAPGSKRFAFYGVDDIETGQKVMEELAKQVNGKANVAILAGNQNAPNLQKRVEGAKKEAEKYPGIKIVGTFYHPETPQDAAAEVVRVNNAYPEITAWAMIGGWPLFTQTLLKDLDPNKTKVVSVDALPAELAYVEKGIAPMLLAQPTYLWGYVSVGKIVDKFVLKQDVAEINKMELVPVTKDNLGTWARQLKDWGFTDVPDKYLTLK
ncbi:MAG TPA: substrate-binding domain-containing protein [Blastocatellia bacterium]|nr:substrate-binding domain-containing protein [Blastocatellia bacterium]